ncbi:ATP-dependent Clp protease ATP-binding subunit [bacterium]|nr:ATP-dependent Clp protease ATP-binding subunit [bacterium]
MAGKSGGKDKSKGGTRKRIVKGKSPKAPAGRAPADVKKKKKKKKQAAGESAESYPVDVADTTGARTIITDIDATIPVVIPPGARSPVDDIIEVLKREVIGQQRAIEAIARALLRSREGFRSPGRPISVMFFAGPTGVGKTETVRALARALHDDWRALLKIDCSEYAEPHAIARLIGAPPGYVGSDLPAIFARENVEGVKNRLILFDEIEKAHFRLHHILLQIMDEGRITLARRSKDDDGIVSFEDCIIVLTSNVGAYEIDDILHANRIGFRNEPAPGTAHTAQQIYVAAKEAMKKNFPPEFRNRITEFIVFRALGRKNLFLILQKLLNISAERFASLGFQLTLSKDARDWLVDRGVDVELGVRPLVRAVEKYIDTKVAELHAYGLIEEGDVLEADVEGSGEATVDGKPKQGIVFYRALRSGEAGAGKRRRKKITKTRISMRY